MKLNSKTNDNNPTVASILGRRVRLEDSQCGPLFQTCSCVNALFQCTYHTTGCFPVSMEEACSFHCLL